MPTMEQEPLVIKLLAHRALIRNALRQLKKKAEAQKKGDEDIEVGVTEHEQMIAACTELIEDLKDQRDIMLEGTPMGDALTAERYKSADGQSLEAGPLGALLRDVDVAADDQIVSTWTLAQREESYAYYQKRAAAIKDKRKKFPANRPSCIPSAWLPETERALTAEKVVTEPDVVVPKTDRSKGKAKEKAGEQGTEKGDELPNGPTPEQRAAAAWICISCRSTNGPDRTTCGNCGEPRSPDAEITSEPPRDSAIAPTSEDPAPTHSTPDNPEKSLAGADESKGADDGRGGTPPEQPAPPAPDLTPPPATSRATDTTEQPSGPWGVRQFTEEGSSRPTDDWEVVRRDPETGDVVESLPQVFADVDLASMKAAKLNRARAADQQRGEAGQGGEATA